MMTNPQTTTSGPWSQLFLVLSPNDEPSNKDRWTMVAAVLVISPDDELSNNDKWTMAQLTW